MARNKDPHDWHGHRIISEDELASPAFTTDARIKRRRTIRHGIILVIVLLALVAAVVLAYLVNTRAVVIDALEPRPVAETPVTEVEACPTTEFSYIDPGKMTVNVMNATQVSGLAGATGTKLKKRGFTVGEVGNARISDVDVVGAVISGPDGYAQAMSMQRNIKDLVYVFDAKRPGATVDLVIGTKYKDLVKDKKVNKKPGKLGCTPPKPKEKKNG
ncbi:LytR C-terminal domain-containing protein [Paeniglutamicibacter antarcticus]|uniref:LytR/CpsA/Psr regulator C-terminal domain-containing protein n=1 Tax=Paeniglutamicibacter antarcticus TaxID=494023 RepID=A0ABP9TLN2_9MICC